MESKLALLLVLDCVFLQWFHAAFADSIQGCGGFVEASGTLAKFRRASGPKLDYSNMTVELHTLDGLVKDSTQCAPNGYYFIPVYDRGQFIVKINGPEGWSFEPSQVIVLVDQNGCNNNEDINFRYTGFTLSGRVRGAVGGSSCLGGAEGPAGVEITLFKIKDGEEQTEKISVVSSAGGNYKFFNVPTGKYRVEASHKKWKIQVLGQSEVELGWGNLVVEDIFFIAGYDISGSVESQGNPVLGVQLYLYSDDVQELLCPQGPGMASPLPKKALCHVVSDADGKFSYSAVPCGNYAIVPFYRGENTIFDVSPSLIDVSVSHDSVEIGKPFQVTGFSVGGRVRNPEGLGIKDVKIIIDDVERAATDAQGFYKLDQVTSTYYTIMAKKAHHKFSSLENFLVLPNIASLPDISATHYAVCGSVSVVTSAHSGMRQVALTHGPANVKPQTKRTDEQGYFCFEVPPGEYRLSPVTTTAENIDGLMFSPSFVDISVSGPILDADFSQAQVSITGVVKCKAGCSPLVTIALHPIDASRTLETELSRKQVLQEGDKFSFTKVLPGKYRLEIRHEPMSKGLNWDDEWCWEQKTLEVQVGTEDMIGLTFTQQGFWLQIKSTHAASAFTLLNKDPMPLQIKKGWQHVCLESSGVHHLHFIWPCVYFGSASFTFDTANPKPLLLVGQKYVLAGHLDIDARLFPDASNLAEAIFVDIRQEDGKLVAHDVRAQLVSDANQTHPTVVYKYAYLAHLGDRLVISARHLSGEPDADQKAREGRTKVKKLLFYPRDQKFNVEADGCQPEIPAFSGRPGVYVTGKVVPPLAGVNITITPKENSDAGRLLAGDIAAWTTTGDDGVFIAGPLYDDTSYSVQALKEGYHLRSIGDNSFLCQELGKISVNILPGEGAEEVLPSVLLSLSGDDGYRKNAATGFGGGFRFENLFPGSFYLRPLLKEYTFLPPAEAIEVGPGEVKEATFTARRMAYSVLGTVTSLSGKPEQGIPLEARAESRGYYEETVTDSEGKYRLRGLLPNTIYTIKVVMKDDHVGFLKIERASPSSFIAKVVDNDTFGVDFVVFDESPLTIITGTAKGANLENWQPNLLVEIASVLDPVKVLQTVPLPLSYFFEIRGLPKGKYIARLAFGLPEQTHDFISDSLEVDLEAKSQVHVGSLAFTVEEHIQKQDLMPAPVLPIVVGVAVILVFVTMPRLKDGYQWAVGSSSSSASPAILKKDIRKIITRTKRAF